MHKYELEAGRAFLRDGVPFAYLAQTKRGNVVAHPSDLDDFAALCATAAELAAMVVAMDRQLDVLMTWARTCPPLTAVCTRDLQTAAADLLKRTRIAAGRI